MASPRNGRLQFIGILLVTGSSAGTFAGNTYQWTDRHGQMHFGDNPPARAESTEIKLPRTRTPAATGLRPGEMARLRELGQRTERQQRLARTARRHSEQQLVAGRAACQAHRKQLHQAQDKDGFKKHAEYLRTHCW